jgi:uncharacterized protein YhaN
MKLISCYIENFGLLHTTDYHFAKDLNCYVSENGTGKTTLTAFIEAMLYGIGEGRKQSLDENLRKKYYPWQGGRFGGSLTLEVGKKRYTIERSFGAKPADDTFRLIDADSGRVSDDYGEDIGEKLFGIDRDGFLRTAFLSEKNLRGKNDNKSIAAKLSDLVGVDGDVGEFDAAIKLLDEKRKFYYKKGNTGEIANVKEKANEYQRKIDALTLLESQTAEKEEELKRLHKEKSELSECEKETRALLDGISRLRERKGHEEIYATMLATLKSEKEGLEKAKKFFEQGVPSTKEIDNARIAKNEAERLKGEALTERGNDEYVALSEFFKNGTSFPEIDSVERKAELIEEKEKQIAEIDTASDNLSRQMKSIFPNGAPSSEEIALVKKTEKNVFVKMALTALATMLMIIGFILGGIFRFTLAPFGFIVSITLAIILLRGRESKKELSFFEKYDKKDCTISDVEMHVERYEQLRLERDRMRASLSDEYSVLTLRVCEFLGKFPVPSANSMLSAVRDIKQKYNKYYALGMATEVSASGKLDKLKESERLSLEAREFLAKFPTVTSDPFAEISANHLSYHQHSNNVLRLERECDEYAIRHGVTGAPINDGANDELSLRNRLAEDAERAKELAAKISLTERDIASARAQLDCKDEYEMAKEEYEERHRDYQSNHAAIQKAMTYLTEACDNITSKYLGKTKERFEEYSRLIAGSEGEYTLSTSFELTRTERGEAHGIDSYSRGIKDLYSLGLRLALIDALYENEAPFIILDDPFIAFDDEKLARAKSTLKTISKTKQILYFTCSTSREIK